MVAPASRLTSRSLASAAYSCLLALLLACSGAEPGADSAGSGGASTQSGGATGSGGTTSGGAPTASGGSYFGGATSGGATSGGASGGNPTLGGAAGAAGSSGASVSSGGTGTAGGGAAGAGNAGTPSSGGASSSGGKSSGGAGGVNGGAGGMNGSGGKAAGGVNGSGGAGGKSSGGAGGKSSGGAGGTGGGACPYTGHVTYTLAKAANPTAEQTKAYGLITAAMDKALSYYNCYANITKNLNVQYEPSVQTADGNINGSLRFGSNTTYMDYRTAMHEIGHTVGVGQASNWSSFLANGLFTGSNATAQLKAINATLQTPLYTEVHADAQHFWPYGLNQQSEAKSEADLISHCQMVVAIRKDLGLQ